MHDYEVIWSRESIYDVADIADYIEQRFGKDRADRFNDEIDVECEALGSDYKLYTGTGISYRGKLILNYTIYRTVLCGSKSRHSIPRSTVGFAN